jgi:hypothetical protein
VTFWLMDSDEALAQAREELSRLGAPAGSELQYTRGNQELTTPFCSTECIAVFLDGVSLPRAVCKNEDVNQVVARLNDALRPGALVNSDPIGVVPEKRRSFLTDPTQRPCEMLCSPC